MEPEAERLQQEIEALLSRADDADTVDDNQFGDLSGDEIPDRTQHFVWEPALTGNAGNFFRGCSRIGSLACNDSWTCTRNRRWGTFGCSG